MSDGGIWVDSGYFMAVLESYLFIILIILLVLIAILKVLA
jgi:hypothetical protein